MPPPANAPPNPRNPRSQPREGARFLILARYRSGSNLLAHGLDSLPGIHMFGELFNLETIARNPHHYTGDTVLRSLRRRAAEGRAVGFKLMYGQAGDIELDATYWGPNLPDRIAGYIDTIRAYMSEHRVASWQHLEDQIVADSSIRVIHLVRENPFHAYVSFQLALRENNWLRRPYATDSLVVDAADLEAWLVRGERFADQYARLFSGHPRLDLTYRDLVDDFAQVIRDAAEFLGVAGLGLIRPALQKQLSKPVAEIVSNYHALRDRFNGTRWADHF